MDLSLTCCRSSQYNMKYSIGGLLHMSISCGCSDEVDTLLGRRNNLELEVPVSMKDEFLAQWDGLETDAASRVIILGATNRPQALCDAMLRR